ncbi:MAG TPA: response regulator, partial [Bacteroidetes bacterium]|nr:response regulator [Bacteroidota bacterium]
MSKEVSKKISVLLVDSDLKGLRELQRYMIHDQRLELAQPCKSGRGALSFLKHKKVDLIILNPALPDANGFDLIASLPDPPATIIVADRKDYAYFAYRIQAIDYLLKPLSVGELDQAISRIITQINLVKEVKILRAKLA